MQVSSLKTENLNHLGLVAGTIKDLGIPDIIDQMLSSDFNQHATKHVKISECISAMILNGLGFDNGALYMVSNFFEDKPLDRLIRDGLKAEHLNDDALGNALDAIADYDPTQFFANIAFTIGSSHNLFNKFARLDSTTFSLEGAYTGFGTTPEESPQLINITHGHSKQHRPDLKQFTLSMVNSGNSGFPFWSESLSGNASDKKSFHETVARVQAFKEQLGDTEPFFWVADSALYTTEQLLRKNVNYFWISRVPESINEAKELVSRRDSELEWNNLPDGYKTTSIKSSYGGVEQRWILVFSQKAFDREIQTLTKKIEKEKATLKKDFWRLANQEFACTADAEKRLAEIIKKKRFHSADFEIKSEAKFSSRGRPKADAKPDKTIVRIFATVKQNEDEIIRAKATKGRFILATNDLDEKELPDEKVLTEYKDLQKVERGFRFLKDPWFLLDNIFLKTPRRIAALSSIMALCLMVYTVAEFKLRQKLKLENKTLPNQLNKEVNNPTLRWIFKMMNGITVVKMKIGKNVQIMVANITELKERIIRLFDKSTQEIYSLNTQ